MTQTHMAVTSLENADKNAAAAAIEVPENREVELCEHLGYDKHDPVGHGTGNSRNGIRSKTVLTDAGGAVDIDVPRDRAGTFEPQIVKKRQRRLTDVDEVVLSLLCPGAHHPRDQRPFRPYLWRLSVKGSPTERGH